jgi:hypothetical protein
MTYLVATLLESSNNVADKTTLNAIGFDCQECAFSVGSGHSLDWNGIALDGKLVVVLIRHHGSCSNKGNTCEFGCSRRSSSGGSTECNGLIILCEEESKNRVQYESTIHSGKTNVPILHDGQ